ncbi:MAG: phosphoglycerate kinase [Gammaproteobacteria bacterium]
MVNNFLRLEQCSVYHKKVLVREDLNVPLKNGVIVDDTRLKAVVPTLRRLLDNGAKIMVMSHLGRPQEGIDNEAFSLAPLVAPLREALQCPVRLEKNWLQGVEVNTGEIVLCENVRFLEGEKANNKQLAQQMAALCDVYVMDAFATAHRAHASTEGVAHFAPTVCAGPLLCKELDALHQVLIRPKAPVVAIVGGAKISTKLTLLKHLSEKVDHLIVGGGIANTCIAAAGYQVQESLYEPELLPIAKQLLAQNIVPLPKDVVVAQTCEPDAVAHTVSLDAIEPGYKVFDVGVETQRYYASLIKEAGTVIWNGPLGVFEVAPFAAGTQALAKAVAQSSAYSIVGGGDTLAALKQWDLTSSMSYVSTAGGAFLAYLEGGALPALTVLEQRALEAPLT